MGSIYSYFPGAFVGSFVGSLGAYLPCLPSGFSSAAPTDFSIY
jgi:hypothetical protein